MGVIIWQTWLEGGTTFIKIKGSRFGFYSEATGPLPPLAHDQYAQIKFVVKLLNSKIYDGIDHQLFCEEILGPSLKPHIELIDSPDPPTKV
jgi:hypothetical protein